MIKDVFAPIVIAISLVAMIIGLCSSMFYLGRKDGIDKYHKMCYDIGGIVVDKKTKTVVVCQKAGVIQEHELDRLDRD